MVSRRDQVVSFNYDKRSAFEYLGRRIRAAFGKMSPLVGYLKLTHRCNLDCPYCPWHSGPTDISDELPTEEWKRIVDDLVSRGVRIFVCEGGEPTLRRDLQDLLDHVHSRGGFTILATNGTTNMWRFSPSAFTVSFDGPEDIHDSIRGHGTYQRARANLQKRTGPQRVLAITVISRLNFAHLEALMEEMASFVNGFLFTFLYPYSASLVAPLTLDEIAPVKDRLIALKSRFRILNPMKQLRRRAGTWKCHDALTVAVDYRGNIRSGCFVDHVEKRDCSRCELSCYQLLSALHDFNFEAWFNVHRFILDSA